MGKFMILVCKFVGFGGNSFSKLVSLFISRYSDMGSDFMECCWLGSNEYHCDHGVKNVFICVVIMEGGVFKVGLGDIYIRLKLGS